MAEASVKSYWILHTVVHCLLKCEPSSVKSHNIFVKSDLQKRIRFCLFLKSH